MDGNKDQVQCFQVFQVLSPKKFVGVHSEGSVGEFCMENDLSDHVYQDLRKCHVFNPGKITLYGNVEWNFKLKCFFIVSEKNE